MDKIKEKGAKESAVELKTMETALKDHPHDTLYINAATSHNTRLAYQSDIADFLKKGGTIPVSSDFSLDKFVEILGRKLNIVVK